MVNSDEIIYEVVSALAEADGVPPQELEYTLSNYVDPVLLEKLVSRDHDCTLTFQVPDHEIAVSADGEIRIDGAPLRKETRSDVEPSGRLQLERFFTNLPCTVYRSRNEPGWPIEFISGNCRELTGYDPNAFIVGGVNFGFDLIHPDDRERVSETVQESVRNEEPFSLVYRIQTAGNTEKWVNEIGVGLVDEEKPISFVGVIIDVADLKTEQDVLRDLKA